MSIRVYALAKELGLETKQLVTICQEAGISVKSGLNALDDQQRESVIQVVQGGASAAPAPAAPPAQETAAPPKPKAKPQAASAEPAPPKPKAKPQAASAKPAPGKPKAAKPATPPADRPRSRPAPSGMRQPSEPPRIQTSTDQLQQRRFQRFMPTTEDRPRRRRPRPQRRDRRGGRRSQTPQARVRIEKATVASPVTLKALSSAIGVKANTLIADLMKTGVMATINQAIADDVAETIAMEHGVELQVERAQTTEEQIEELLVADKLEDLTARPPVVTVLGHVDHGKTSLLDAIRKTNVTAGESGGITQHIGASVVRHGASTITFVDTPGHEAFTAMRARGANVTDIVVLVVAADDGVMPQTEEAIAHAKAADVPIVVAVNKVDKPEANINRVYQQLSGHDLIPEEWGGDTIFVKTSAITGEGLEDLLENLVLLAEILELRAAPAKPAVGNCLEANRTTGRGVVATFLVREGTLHRGDAFVCGACWGRVRQMYNEHDKPIRKATPSTPVLIAGLDDVPDAGDKFVVLPSLENAREIAEQYQQAQTPAGAAAARPQVTLENLFEHIQSGKVKDLNLILKADVRGTLEAIRQELAKLDHEEVKIRILYEGVGGINESDIQLADASGAIAIGFQVRPDDRAQALADAKGIDVRVYHVIYEMTDELKAAVEGLLEPEQREVRTARLEVRDTFKISRIGTIAGGYVREGTISRGDRIRLWRDNVSIYEGAIESLRRFKDDVSQVREGFECGLKIAGYDDLRLGDVVEAYRIEKIKRTL